MNTDRFCPAAQGQQAIAGCPFNPAQHWLVGTVGRMQTIKDQTMLAQAGRIWLGYHSPPVHFTTATNTSLFLPITLAKISHTLFHTESARI